MVFLPPEIWDTIGFSFSPWEGGGGDGGDGDGDGEDDEEVEEYDEDDDAEYSDEDVSDEDDDEDDEEDADRDPRLDTIEAMQHDLLRIADEPSTADSPGGGGGALGPWTRVLKVDEDGTLDVEGVHNPPASAGLERAPPSNNMPVMILQRTFLD